MTWNKNELPSGEIHLWLAFYDEIGQTRNQQYLALLTPREREQQTRFYFARDRLRYLVTRVLVRTVLSRYAAVAPSEWSFGTNEFGRPTILNPGFGQELCFNISHTHSLIVLAVARQRELGVDVENVCDRRASIGIADRFFAAEEVATLNALPADEQHARFFEYWTFKESYIKARGLGLSIPLDRFSFRFPHPAGVEITIDDELGDDARRWQFWQFRPKREYLVAICAERDHGATQLIVKSIVPAGGIEELLRPQLSRWSG